MKILLYFLFFISTFSYAQSLPEDATNTLKEIVDLFKSGPKESAIKRLKENEKRLLQALSESKDGDSYLLLGRAYFYAEMDDEAEINLKKALSYNEDLPRAHSFIGLVNMYSGKFNEAEVSFQNAILLDDSNEDYFVELGRIQEKLDKPKLALSQYKRALGINELNYTANYNLASIYANEGDNVNAEKHYVLAYEKKPDDIDLNYNLGQLYQNTKQHNLAIKYFSKVVSVDAFDWRAVAKIIQENQAINNIVERDKSILYVYKLWKENKIDELVDQGFFIREQSLIEEGKLFVLEYFELVGERARKFVFVIQDPSTGEDKFEISLGSYDSTTEYSRASGSIGPTDRIYHLDGYSTDGSHYTYEFFNGQPTYDDTKKIVFDVLSGKQEIISSTVPSSDKNSVNVMMKDIDR